MTNPAREALDLLRNKMTGADLAELTSSERQQLAAALDHWLKRASTPTTTGA